MARASPPASTKLLQDGEKLDRLPPTQRLPQPRAQDGYQPEPPPEAPEPEEPIRTWTGNRGDGT